jgi:hypothetical protein
LSFIDSAIGLILLILAAALLFIFALPRRNRSARPLRPISAFQQLQRAIGLAVEEGKGLHVTIGEELFAIPAYMQAGPAYAASLRVQDLLRWVLIILLLGGAVLKILGISIL